MITTTGLTRASALAAVAAGLLFVGVQVGHPHLDVTTVTTTDVVVRNWLKALMGVLALAGVSGVYLHGARSTGVTGLVGYLLLAMGYLGIVVTSVVAAAVLPPLAVTAPAFVSDAIAAATGGTPEGDLGGLGVLIHVQGVCYLLGGAVLGVALLRARTVARWAAALLATGGVVTVVLSVMPDAFYRLLALPNAAAMVGLGWSLWTLAGRGRPGYVVLDQGT